MKRFVVLQTPWWQCMAPFARCVPYEWIVETVSRTLQESSCQR